MRASAQAKSRDLRPHLTQVFGTVLGFQSGLMPPVFPVSFHCEFAGCTFAQRLLRFVPVVIVLPCRDIGASLGERRE